MDEVTPFAIAGDSYRLSGLLSHHSSDLLGERPYGVGLSCQPFSRWKLCWSFAFNPVLSAQAFGGEFHVVLLELMCRR